MKCEYDYHREQPTVQNGKFFEGAAIGVCSRGDRKYQPYRESMEWVKDHQPQEKPLVSRKLRRAVQEKLPSVDHVLRLYTAVGSPLDTMHGVDGFFELGPYTITFDLTLDDKAKVKADVLIRGDSEAGLTEEIIEEASADIARQFAILIELHEK